MAKQLRILKSLPEEIERLDEALSRQEEFIRVRDSNLSRASAQEKTLHAR